MKAVALSLSILLLYFPILCAQSDVLIFDSGFEDADLTGWRLAGDICVAPAFCAGQPTGRYWAALSTNSANGDSITMCGTSSVGGVHSVLRTPPVPLPFKVSRIRIDFKVKFLTNESTGTDLGTDLFQVRLLTASGPVIISAMDDSGPAANSKNLMMQGDAQFKESLCNPTWRYETGMLNVSYFRTFRDPFAAAMMNGPVALEFALSNHYDQDFDSAVVIDDIQIRVYR